MTRLLPLQANEPRQIAERVECQRRQIAQAAGAAATA
jgi:hypothetical protein